MPVAERADSLFGGWLGSRLGSSLSRGFLGRLRGRESAEKVVIIAAGFALVASGAGFGALRLSAAGSGFAALFGAARPFDENILGFALREVLLHFVRHRL